MTLAYPSQRNLPALAGVAALHAGLLLGLWQVRPASEMPALPQAMMISLLQAPEPQTAPKPAPRPAPAVREPVRQQQPVRPALKPAPLLAVRSESPVAASVPEPIVQKTETPAPAAETAPAASAAAPTPEPAAPVAPPDYKADYLGNPSASYPPLSRRLGEQGEVLLHVLVNPEGRADKIDIRNSSGFERLDKAARDAVKQWRFAPARQGDKKIAAWVLVPVQFSLRS